MKAQRKWDKTMQKARLAEAWLLQINPNNSFWKADSLFIQQKYCWNHLSSLQETCWQSTTWKTRKSCTETAWWQRSWQHRASCNHPCQEERLEKFCKHWNCAALMSVTKNEGHPKESLLGMKMASTVTQRTLEEVEAFHTKREGIEWLCNVLCIQTPGTAWSQCSGITD